MNNFFNGKKQIKIKEDKNKKTKIRETIYIMIFFFNEHFVSVHNVSRKSQIKHGDLFLSFN
jgi:hypothetical protein